MALIGSIENQGNLQGQINDANGYLTGVISNAGLLGGQVVAERGLKGDKGDKGDTGATGSAATVSVGSTTTGAAGTSASVSNSGTQHAAIFDFIIPKGDKGDTGATGEGATIAIGSTSTGAAGTSASVVNSGTSTSAIFDFTIPKGDKGDTGNTGSAATIAIGSVSTGGAGTSASVVNSGTSASAIFDFTIPKGDKGDTGASGSAATIAVGSVSTGAAGTSASITNSGTSTSAIFDFIIPKGDKGDTGQTGSGATISIGSVTTGAAGTSASVVNSGTSTSAVLDFTIPKGDTGATGGVNDVEVNGTSVVNAGVAEVTVPTKTSDLNNDSLFARGHVGAFHGTCSTAAGTGTKVVTCADFTSADLVAGALIVVTFSNANSAAVADLKLDVNGTGAKAIKQNGSGTLGNLGDKSYLKADSYPFVYNGTYWICWYDTNTNTIGYTIRTNGSQLPVKTACYRYRICFTSADGKQYIPANASTSTSATSSKTVTTEKIDPFGRIIYYNYTTAISAGGSIGTAYHVQQYNGVTLGYSFNRTGAALTMTAKKPVYVKCTPQTDGSAIIDDTTPFVQDLPTTEDGKIYIFIGVATSATAIEFTLEHPVYCYKNGCVRQWTNASITKSQVSDFPTNVSSFNNDSGYLTAIDLADNVAPPVFFLNVNGASVSLENGNGVMVGISELATAFKSALGVQLFQILNISGDNVEVRAYEIVKADAINAKARLVAVDSGTVYVADLQDFGSGLGGTFSTISLGGTGTVTSVSAGIGLTTSDGNAITSTGTVKAKLTSETPITDVSKVYSLGVNSNGELVTKVGWSDIQTRTSDSGTDRTIYLAGGSTSSDETGGLSKHGSANVYVGANTSTAGDTRLNLGNSTASGTAGAKEGSVRLYGSSTSYTDLKVSATSSAKTITFPNASGTVALTSDIHNVPSGGSADQVLAKNSNTDYDLKWVNAGGGGAVPSHTHGYITNDGKLQETSVHVAAGDQLVITDYNDSKKVVKSDLSFDGTGTMKYLSKAGTWERLADQIRSVEALYVEVEMSDTGGTWTLGIQNEMPEEAIYPLAFYLDSYGLISSFYYDGVYHGFIVPEWIGDLLLFEDGVHDYMTIYYVY